MRPKGRFTVRTARYGIAWAPGAAEFRLAHRTPVHRWTAAVRQAAGGQPAHPVKKLADMLTEIAMAWWPACNLVIDEGGLAVELPSIVKRNSCGSHWDTSAWRDMMAATAS